MLAEDRWLHRERRLEKLNRRCMASEEKRQIRAVRHERRLEHGNRVALAKEDRLSRRWQRGRGSFECLAARICALLRRWRRCQERDASLEERKKQEALRRQAADRARERRRLAALSSERWKWMNRRDITMSEILRGFPSDGPQ
eukprot:gnl/TRDRNA2_/TRDRNA2_79856_c2_seq1.p1 gnl/TRDRNA2_/TRDRNA2_79856_c2~~gnl/TRDRNA2_/TRDRNA2_79856_c2_seq1.p1  ORF type:complete len:155 (+),score=18.75 gnl/TRDRNA2_/TRDRNA2_79856_c2_seq1:39-467(+)